MVKVVTTTIVDGELVKTDHEIEGSPRNFTVIVHQQGIKVEVPEFVEIDPQDTIRCMSEMTQKQWEWISTGGLFSELWKEAFDPSDRMDPPKSIEMLNMTDMGIRHMAGMIVLGCEACFQGRSVFFRNPETYLHPKTERYVGGMLQKMLNISGNSGTVTETAEDAPKEKEFNIDLAGDIKQEISTIEKEKNRPVDTELTLKWLGCMEAGKDIVERNGERLTVEQLTDEVTNNTDLGRWFVDKFVELRDGKKG